jgi:uncharacterized protein involved in exopolysaccharide biosynthesis
MTAAQPFIAVSRRPLDLEDYVNVARRHSGWIAGPTFAGLVISVVIAFSWPNTYEAKALMQITPSRIDPNLVQSVVTQHITERIEQMRSNITSRASLANIINDPALGLYKEEKAKEPMEDVEDEMRSAIRISINPETVSKNGASVFSISFQYRTRKGAMETVNRLITRFIQESTVSQHDQQTTITDYFGDALAQAKAGLEKEGELLNKFRKDNEGSLPEQESMNVETLHSLENQVNTINQDLQRFANERVTIETQITALENELKLNETFAQEVADTPLPNSTIARQNDDLVAINKSIESEELQLSGLKQIYKPDYVDIRTIETHLKVLQKKRDELQTEQAKQQSEEAAKPKPAPKKTTNFTALANENKIKSEIDHYRALLQINDTNKDRRLEDRERFTKEAESYRARLARTSQIEASYQDLLRDYKTAAEKYEKYEKDTDLTKQSGELISRRATESMDTLDAPTIPHEAAKPHRGQIVGIGFAIALMVGLALAGVQEARDSSLKNLKDVRAYTNLPVLCSIPLLENTLLVRRKRRITYLAWSAAVIVGILAVGCALFYYSTEIATT